MKPIYKKSQNPQESQTVKDFVLRPPATRHAGRIQDARGTVGADVRRLTL